MCVIMYAGKVRPTPDMVHRAFDRNQDGGGIAWREPAEDGNGTEVVWKKGLKREDMLRLCADLPLPYIVHFRVGSSGPKTPQLCHPFPVDLDAPNITEGRTRGYVMFHNGDWREWRADLKHAVVTFGAKLPIGKCSDTRAMSVLLALYGNGYMDLIEQKGIVFSPNDTEFFEGTSGWKKINDVWCSNDLFMPINSDTCRGTSCFVRINLDKEGYCTACARERAEKEKRITALTSMHGTADPGGDRKLDPFRLPMGTAEQKLHAVRVGEAMHRAKQLSKKQLKKLKKLCSTQGRLIDIRKEPLSH